MSDYNQNYAVFSLELHLFFARIMKEHSLFLMAASTPADASCSKSAEYYKQEFEKLLGHAVNLGNGVIGPRVLSSGEIVTEFTAKAEQQTEQFTGIPIDKEITRRETCLNCGEAICASTGLLGQIRYLNQSALWLLSGLIELKETILDRVLHFQMFTMNYPLLLEHIIREAKLYYGFIENLEKGTACCRQSMRDTELFWNQIMMEHAMFIRGLLDPSENELIKASDDFANDYAALLARARTISDNTIVRREALQETLRYRDFKAAGTKGIQDCQIRSIILPLLADHVLREASHYIRLLSE